MKKAVFMLLGGLFIFVSCLVFFWTLSIIGFVSLASRKERAYREGGEQCMKQSDV